MTKKKSKKPTQTSKRTTKQTGFSSSLKLSLEQLKKYPKTFFGLLCINALLHLLFVSANRTVSSAEIIDTTLGESGANSLAEEYSSLIGGSLSAFNSESTEVHGFFSYAIIMLFGMMYISYLRSASKSKAPALKDIFYRSSKQLVPFIAITSIIVLQLLPFFLSMTIFAFANSSDVATTGMQNIVISGIAIAGSALSLYLLSGSIFAVFAITLDGSNPLETYREIRGLVRGKRFKIATHILLFLAAILSSGALLFVATIILIGPGMALLTLDLLFVSALPLTLSFFFQNYRELVLDDR